MNLKEMFAAADGEFLMFDRIPEAERLHPVRDVCAFLYLSDKLKDDEEPPDGNVVVSAEHDVIHLRGEPDQLRLLLTPADVVYLHRCGVRLGDYGLEMFV